MNKSFESTVDVDSFLWLNFQFNCNFKTITLNANVNLVFVGRNIIFLKNVDFYWFIVSPSL